VKREPDGTILIPDDGLLDLIDNTDLEKLRNHQGMVRAYKVTDANANGPHHHAKKLDYAVGKKLEVFDANTKDSVDCGAGINLTSRAQGKKWAQAGYRMFIAEFHSDDIAAIPTLGDKMRVHRCKIVEEIDPTNFKALPAPVEVIDKDTPTPPAREVKQVTKDDEDDLADLLSPKKPMPLVPYRAPAANEPQLEKPEPEKPEEPEPAKPSFLSRVWRFWRRK
jgi:hypothetical protein